MKIVSKAAPELQILNLICDSGMTLFGVDDAAALLLQIYFYI